MLINKKTYFKTFNKLTNMIETIKQIQIDLEDSYITELETDFKFYKNQKEVIMKETITIQICSCSNCVMSGAMGISTSVDSLRKLQNQLEFEKSIIIEHVNYIPVDNSQESMSKKMHTKLAPVIKIGEEIITSASTDTVMSTMVSYCKGNK